MAFCCGGPSVKRYATDDSLEASDRSLMDFRHIPEPHLGELAYYLRQRRDNVVILATTEDVRTEITKNGLQPVDQYPKGRLFLNDEDYMMILRDLLNLSNILDDMEQTGFVPYTNRTSYYSKLPHEHVAKYDRES